MAKNDITHEASASATGYLYQCRIALLLGLKAIPLNPDLLISVEKFDDVAFDTNGTPSELIQTKHHIGNTGNLSNASSDLWNTLLIWTKATKADLETPFRTKFILLTTGQAPSDSAASFLRASSRDEKQADKILCETASKSSSKENKSAYVEYTSLPEEIQERLRENQQQIATRIQENEFLRGQQETFVLQARAIGKITQYVETVSSVDASSTLRARLDIARSKVAMLEQELDPDAARERLETFLNIIGSYMTEYSTRLDLEHRGSQLRLEPRTLTVVADTLNGPVPLFRMGSGENWVGYHVLAHLALCVT